MSFSSPLLANLRKTGGEIASPSTTSKLERKDAADALSIAKGHPTPSSLRPSRFAVFDSRQSQQQQQHRDSFDPHRAAAHQRRDLQHTTAERPAASQSNTALHSLGTGFKQRLAALHQSSATSVPTPYSTITTTKTTTPATTTTTTRPLLLSIRTEERKSTPPPTATLDEELDRLRVSQEVVDNSGYIDEYEHAAAYATPARQVRHPGRGRTFLEAGVEPAAVALPRGGDVGGAACAADEPAATTTRTSAALLTASELESVDIDDDRRRGREDASSGAAIPRSIAMKTSALTRTMKQEGTPRWTPSVVATSAQKKVHGAGLLKRLAEGQGMGVGGMGRQRGGEASRGDEAAEMAVTGSVGASTAAPVVLPRMRHDTSSRQAVRFRAYGMEEDARSVKQQLLAAMPEFGLRAWVPPEMESHVVTTTNGSVGARDGATMGLEEQRESRATSHAARGEALRRLESLRNEARQRLLESEGFSETGVGCVGANKAVTETVTPHVERGDLDMQSRLAPEVLQRFDRLQTLREYAAKAFDRIS